MGIERVTMKFNVGVAGYRDISTSSEGALKTSIYNVLRVLKVQFSYIHDELLVVCDSHASTKEKKEGNLTLISNLAEGADLLVTRSAVDLGYDLAAVLPRSPEEYGRSFGFRTAQKEMERMYEVAKNKFVLDETAPSSSAGYRNAAHIVLNHADILLALWDGKSTKYIAGTYAPIKEALKRRMSVVYITKDEAFTPCILYRGERRYDIEPTLREIMEEGILPNRSLPPSEQAGLVKSVLPIPEYRDRRLVSFDGVMEGLLLHPEQYLKSLFVAEKARHLPPVEKPCTFEFSQKRWDAVKRDFSTASRFYAKRYRNSLFLRFILPVVAITSLILALNVSNYGIDCLLSNMVGIPRVAAKQWAASVLYIVQLVALLGTIGIVWRSRRSYDQHRYNFYRVFAEHCRVNTYLWAVGYAGSSQNESYSLISWYSRLVARQFGLPCIELRDKKLREWLGWLKESFLKPQLKYHEKRLRKCLDLQNTLGQLAFWSFVLSIVVTVVRAVTASSNAGAVEYFPKWIEYVAGGLALLFPCLASFWASYSNNAGYPADSASSNSMVSAFTSLINEVDELNKKEDLSYSDINDLCRKVDSKCMEELNEWESGLRKRELRYV